jgi:galactose mutarotase-like enzyme
MRNAVDNNFHVRHEQGFEVYVLNNQDLELAVVPELGARIISLKDRRTGREWMWHPAGGRKLFRNRCGDDFAGSPLAGLDECLPTIAPCSWQGRQLPDHGEAWAVPWAVDRDAWADGVLCTKVSLQISPFDFERTIELADNEIRLDYRLTNRSANQERYLWAMHPLLRLQSGDRLELPASTRALLNGSPWIDVLNSDKMNGACEKIFAWPVSEGLAAIHNPETGDRLAFKWDAAENKTLGLWLTRGGWHGHHHFAIEPANGEPDTLSAATQRDRCGAVPPHGSAGWQVVLQLGS